MKIDQASKDYGKVTVVPLGFDFEASQRCGTFSHLALSPTDVLGIVQSAFDELGSNDPAFIAVKRQVLDAVSEGKLAEALRTAIVGAGKRA